MVMGDNSCYRGCGFESLHRILDGHFFIDLLKIALFVCLKKRKRGRVWPILKNNWNIWAVILAQWADWSLLTPEIRTSNPVTWRN